MTSLDSTVVLIAATALLCPRVQPEQHYQDSVDSLLYTQLLANKNVGARFGRQADWQAARRQAFSSLGWLRLASVHEQKNLGASPVTSGVQPFQAWLQTREIDYQAVVSVITGALRGSAASLRHLMNFAVSNDEAGSQLEVDIGLLRPGPTLDLCSLSWRSAQPLSAAPLDALLAQAALHGEVTLDGLSLRLDAERFAAQRSSLRELIANKQRQGSYVLELGGDEHE